MAALLRRTSSPASLDDAAAPTAPHGAAGTPSPTARAQWLSLAEPCQGLRWRLQRWRSLLPTLVCPHRLHAQRCGHYASRTQPGPLQRGRFADLFDLRSGTQAVGYPFLYAQGVIDLLQARVLADLGVNARHLRLLRHRTRLLGADPARLGQALQDVDCRLARVVRVGPTEVAALLQTGIADEDGTLIAQIEDLFVVRELPVAYAVQADEDDLLRRAVSRMRRHAREIDAAAPGVRQRQLLVTTADGRRFAALAGGPLRLPRWPRAGARWWRLRAPALAPMYLRHLVARELAEWGLDLGSLQMTFIGRVAAGQTLQLLQQGRAFELLDAQGRLLACGRI
ncbi:MAG: hypothetical protein AMXMBFR78_04090 [Rubrivivax sp.]|jgi:hypothetical protein